MSITKDYLERLDTEVGIAPAGSQEELDCAQNLAEMYSAHGIKPEVQDFVAPSLGNATYGGVLVLLFVGLLLAGVGGVPTTVVGVLLVIASIVLLGMTYSGKDVLAKVGPRAHSQNVVGYREAGVDSSERNRPIVIVAHYDTGRIDPLSRPQVAVAKKYLASYSKYLVIAVAVCTLIQVLGFLPEPARRTFWVIGLIACLPLLAWGISLIAGKFMPYTSGAVDNKSSVAAMLGIMDRVSGGIHVAAPKAKAEEPVEVAPSVSAPKKREPEMRREVEEVLGTRHGEKVIRELGILPESCSITYIEPEVRMVPVAAPLDENVERAAESESTIVTEPVDASTTTVIDEPGAEAESACPQDERAAADPVATVSDVSDEAPLPTEPEADVQAPDEVQDAPDATPESESTVEMPVPVELDSADDGERGATRPMAPVSQERIDTDAERLSKLEDGQSTDEGPLVETDHSGLNAIPDEDAATAASVRQPARPRPDAVSDPDWGKSSYKPTRRANVSNVARRAALFDLPDPKTSAQDGLGTTTPTQLPPRSAMAQRLADASRQVVTTPAPVRINEDAAPVQGGRPAQRLAASEDIEVLHAPANQGASEVKRSGHHGLSGLFGSKKRKQEDSMSEWLGVDENYDAKRSGESIGSWDNFDNDSHTGGWKGGAALNVNLRKLKDKLPSIPMPGKGEAAEEASADVQEPEADDRQDSAEMPVQAQDASSEGVDGASDPIDQPEAYEPVSYDEATDIPTTASYAVSNTDRALRDSILAMGDDELRTHDIWFVATGASSLGHAGASAFVEEYRKRLRGAFVINLECVGAGDLTVLTHEGFGTPRRADRRFSGLLSAVADDLHLRLDKVARPWANTEATMFMRKHLRAVTLMGMGPGELPACAHTNEDVPESVNPERVEDVCALVLEAIRRA